MKKFIPKFVFKVYHFLLTLAGALIYGFPSRKLIVVGVTGTNGKSTVVSLISEILEKSGHKTASLSSIRFKISEKEWKNMLKMTMPGRMKIQKFLRQAVKEGCKHAVLEVTSEGIKQFRHKFIEFNGAVFTNLTREHIEAHKGFENYKKAKGKLFKALEKSSKKNKFAVLNVDDENSQYFSNLFSGKKYFYGIKNKQAEITPEKIGLKLDNLAGEFNVYNALAAFCAGVGCDIPRDKILSILRQARGIPGRMELVMSKPFKVYVDYAHTPDALEKVYQSLRAPNSQLICVFGSAGGGRDKWKRPEIGKIAGEYCKEIILTNEDPFDEPPMNIIDQIASGINSKKPIYKIIDRREAINKALALARNDDMVIITGKGCEQYIRIEKGKTIPWDDREVVREEYKKIYG